MKNNQDQTASPLGEESTDSYGFPTVSFSDRDGSIGQIRMSSVIGNYADSIDRPGTSALLLGIPQPNAVVRAKHAAAVGVETEKEEGWVEYPLPEEVLVDSYLHLDREQVCGLIARLQHWLDNGNFTQEDRAEGLAS